MPACRSSGASTFKMRPLGPARVKGRSGGRAGAPLGSRWLILADRATTPLARTRQARADGGRHFVRTSRVMSAGWWRSVAWVVALGVAAAPRPLWAQPEPEPGEDGG